MKKVLAKLLVSALSLVLMVSCFVMPAAAFTPIADDIYFYDGYDITSGLSVLKQVDNGMNIQFKRSANNMWSNRVKLNYPLNLGKTEGFYCKLSDIKLAAVNCSMCITLTASAGGWSDCRSLMFWIVKRDGNFQIAGLRGNDPDETNVKQFFLDYTDIPNISSDMVFWFRKTSNTDWTLTINNTNITISNDIVTNRFITLSPIYVTFGTWDCASASNADYPVSYTVSDIYFNNCIEYNSPSSECAKRMASNGTLAAATTATAYTGSDKSATTKSVQSGNNSTHAVISGSADAESSSDLTTSSVSESSTDSTTTTQATDITAETATSSDSTLPAVSQKSSFDGWVILAVIAAVLILALVGFVLYFALVKKENIFKKIFKSK